MRTAERFAMVAPVYETLAEDSDALAKIEDMIRTALWREQVEEAGGEPYGEPEISREPNVNYGSVLCDGRGGLVLGENGEPLVDHVKLYLHARGWAFRSGDGGRT